MCLFDSQNAFFVLKLAEASSSVTAASVAVSLSWRRERSGPRSQPSHCEAVVATAPNTTAKRIIAIKRIYKWES
jgi:hypothetical protein